MGALILLGIAADAQERGASAELAVLEVAMPILEQVAIDGGGSVHHAGREAVWACAVLAATPWWCFALAGIPLLAFAGNPARGGSDERADALDQSDGVQIQEPRALAERNPLPPRKLDLQPPSGRTHKNSRGAK